MQFRKHSYTIGEVKNYISIFGHGFSENYGRYYVTVSHALSYYLDRNPTNKQHFHPEYEFNLVVSGSGKYYEEGKTYSLEAGDIFITDPNKIHEISSLDTKDLQFLWINVYIKHLEIPETGSYEDQLVGAFLQGHDNFMKNQQQILLYYPQFKRFSSSPMDFRLSGKLLVQSFFFNFMELMTKRKPMYHSPENSIGGIPTDTINRAHDFIINNITSDISVGDVADAVGCTQRNLRYTFRKNLDCTVISYIQKCKFEYACHLLKLGMQVQEVSHHLSFESPSIFSRAFKRRMGTSPITYRQPRFRDTQDRSSSL